MKQQASKTAGLLVLAVATIVWAATIAGAQETTGTATNNAAANTPVVTNPDELLASIEPIVPDVEYTQLNGGREDCGHMIVGSFVATDDVTELWSSDFETWYSLWVDESGLANPTVGDLTRVGACEGYLDHWTTLGRIGNHGSHTTLETTPGVTYYLGWSQEDRSESWMLAPTNPLRRPLDGVELIDEGELVEIVGAPETGIDFDVEGSCGRLVASFVATQARTTIMTTDVDTAFALHQLVAPYEGLDETPELVTGCQGGRYVPDGGPWERYGIAATGTGRALLDLIPGERYWISWSMEDREEAFAINGEALAAFKPSLVTDQRVTIRVNDADPKVTNGDCAHRILGSFVADDHALDLWAEDNELSYALYAEVSESIGPLNDNLAPATPCANTWQDLEFGGTHAALPTEPGQRYYLGWNQEDEVEPLTINPSDPLKVPPRVLPVVSCLAERGRFDFNLTNPTSTAGTYRIDVAGLTPRAAVVAPGDAGRVSITGRPAGTYAVTVTRDGVALFDDTLTVDCERPPPGPEVQVISSCLGGRGFVRFLFANPTDAIRSWRIEFPGVPNRSTSAGAFAQSLRATSGRPDGRYEADIYGPDNELVATKTVTVNCSPY